MQHALVRVHRDPILDFFEDTLVDDIFFFVVSDAAKLCYFGLVLGDHFVLVLYVLPHHC
jgi:hypothetical protein